MNDVMLKYYSELSSRYKYESTGLPWTSSKNKKGKDRLQDQLDKISYRVFYEGKPAAIIIDGVSGNGKTTMGYHVAEYIGMSLIDPEIQHGQGTKDFLKKAKHAILLKKKAALYDEAGEYDKKTFWSELNRMLNRFFDIYRTFAIIPIIILPFSLNLDNGLYDKGIPRLLIHCRDKNKGGGYSCFDVYGLVRQLYLRNKAMDKKLIAKQFAYKQVTPNFRGYFKDLPKERSTQLDKISSHTKMSEFHELDIASRGLMTYKDLSNKIGRSEDWIKREVSKNKIKEVEKYKKRKYFDKQTLQRLQGIIKKKYQR